MALVIAGFSAAACSGPVTVPGVVDSAYGPEVINYAASSGGMPVQVVGNPFPVTQAELDRIIAATMEVSYFGQPMPFFTERPPDFRSPYYIVLIFNPTLGTNNQALCVKPDQPTAVQPGELRIMAALCSSERRLTSTSGRIPLVADPRDPVFRQLVSQATYDLLPPYSERFRDRNRPGVFFGPF